MTLNQNHPSFPRRRAAVRSIFKTLYLVILGLDPKIQIARFTRQIHFLIAVILDPRVKPEEDDVRGWPWIPACAGMTVGGAGMTVGGTGMTVGSVAT